MIIGGPALNVSLLTKHIDPAYETTLIVGSPDAHEKKADYLLKKMDIHPIYIPEMGREISMIDDMVAYHKIKSIIKELKPDIVHTHTSKPGAIGRWAAAACHVPVVVHTFHGHVFHSYFSPLKTKIYIGIERRLAQKSTKLIAISDIQKKELTETYKIAPPEKVDVINLGLNLEPFTELVADKRKTFREQYQLPDEVIAIGIIGRLAPIKNHRLFIDAVHQLTQRGQQKIRGFIIGNGECMADLQAYCTSLQLGFSTPENPDYSQPIIFTSWRTDIDVVNAGLDIITLTSFNEGTPVSIIEAQAAAKPIVATLCGGIRDVVLENKTAFLSPVDNKELFIQHLEQVVNNADLRASMSEHGPAFAINRFGYKRLITETEALYAKLLAEAGR